ncbi:MAG: Eco57I restriction-modification methylase domain-containing protein [Candidatus Delongbacteria bacterium]|nr:Eco57I restriction-modification methylase domain-containing protein [Candidatus Delongbacteria bacterium]MBN2835310.1 Eco57I restriction-modification methylase domain-containing protein [Candidatus Delongbacteria bacterium]
MKCNLLTIGKSLNKAFVKVKPSRIDIENFKQNLISLFDKLNENESEEYHKNLITAFLKETYYGNNYNINTKGRNDLVIHSNNKANSSVSVIIETKKPSNKYEMISKDKINAKALHELVYYFLKERVTLKNLDVKNLIITNVYEWYIFNSNEFERIFANDKKLVKKFEDFEEGRLSGKTTDFFYKEIAENFITNYQEEISCTYFDIRDFKTPLFNNEKSDDSKLIKLYKVFTPEHLLKLPFVNDSNSLDKRFYGELLHIIGLTEIKSGSKKLIERQSVEKRESATLLESTIVQLDSLEKLTRLDKPETYGKTIEERYFNIGLELCITWINRILFLKLLEAQLLSYHKRDKTYKFLSYVKIKNYDDLNSLFFQVLARKLNERNIDVKELYKKVPYLNSSLFEPTELEQLTVFISNLKDDREISIYQNTILKDSNGTKLTGKLNTLEYLFKFLDSYDFSSEGSEEIQEENKTLINASVLGLIFEKINGYKDGSFFTPGFITMYMSREAIRRAVIQKFNTVKKWSCKNITELYNKIEDSKEANEIINSLKICDPAVGSGHFLVSVLNEILAIKSELKILLDRSGKRLKEYSFEVVNDELIIMDEDGKLFEYTPKNKESQRVQEAIFHEKQSIIENCLFGVDINPNSVKICRLRLWIELLKNAYYKNDDELETLPNIDINIKCGNSLISRFDINSDIKKALKKSKWNISSYKLAVSSYQNAKSKEEKREMEKLINEIKKDFRSEILDNDPKKRRFENTKATLEKLVNQLELFEKTKKEKEEFNKKVEKLSNEINKLDAEIKEIENNAIYENSFEWRFEFPEVLDENGDFVGFDVVIGNPPYVGIEDITWSYRRFFETVYKTATGRFDLYSLFIEKAMQIKQTSGVFSFIIPGKFLNNKQFAIARKIVCDNHGVTVVKIDDKVFEDAQVDSVIVENYQTSKAKYKAFKITMQKLILLSETDMSSISKEKEYIFRLEINTDIDKLSEKIEANTYRVKQIAEVKDGIVAGTIKDILYINEQKDNTCYKLFFGKHLSKYSLTDTNVWVNYKPDEMMQEEVKRKKGKRAGLWLRNENIFKREKILSRFVAKEMIATYDDKQRYYEHTIHSTYITDKRFKVKYVLGLFNSTLFKFYYQKTNSQGGDIFPQVRISSVENLPIKFADIKIQEQIEKIVDQILVKKSCAELEDTSDLEHEIDQLVYQLYDLTSEEVEIIENYYSSK